MAEPLKWGCEPSKGPFSVVQPCEITEPYDFTWILNHEIAHFHDFHMDRRAEP